MSPVALSGRPRVLFAIPSLLVGGAEMQVRMMAPRHVGHGLGVGLLTRLAAADAESFRAAGVEVFPLSAGNYSPRLLTQSLGAVRRFRPDIVYSWIKQTDIIFGLLRRVSAWRWVMAEASSAANYRSGAKSALRLRLGWSADGIIANSAAGAEMWAGHPRVAVIANGIDYDRFSTAEPARTGPGPAPLVAVCRLIPTKRVDVLLDAVARVRAARPEVRLIIVGDGPERPRLEAQAAALGIGDTVEFLGMRNDVPRWFRAAELVLSASAVEGQSNSTMEAAASGAPLLLTDIEAHTATFGADAAYVPVGDPEALASAIVAHLADPGPGRARAARAQAAMQRFTIDRTVAEHVGFFRALRAAGSA